MPVRLKHRRRARKTTKTVPREVSLSALQDASDSWGDILERLMTHHYKAHVLTAARDNPMPDRVHRFRIKVGQWLVQE